MDNKKETRRKFFKQGIAASAGLALTPALVKGDGHKAHSDPKPSPHSKTGLKKK